MMDTNPTENVEIQDYNRPETISKLCQFCTASGKPLPILNENHFTFARQLLEPQTATEAEKEREQSHLLAQTSPVYQWTIREVVS